MKNIVYILITLSSLLGAFEVHTTKEFVAELEPTKMSTSLIATFTSRDKSSIQKVFKEAIEGTERENICTNGSYRISPQYVYNKQVRSFIGYQGSITFRCDFVDTQKLDNVISHLDSIKSKNEGIKLTINPIRWIVQKDTVNEKKGELELQALHFAKEYAEFLSKEYRSQCAIAEVSLNHGANYVDPTPRHMMMSEAKSQTTRPIKSDQTVRYKASYKFSCK